MRLCVLFCAVIASAALGYIHVPPQSLKEICAASGQIRALKVTDINKEKGVVLFEVAEVLRAKSKSGVRSFRLLVRPDARGGKAIVEKLAVGQMAVLFSVESGGKSPSGYGYAFIDKDAYSLDYNAASETWLLLRAEPGLSSVYHGAAKDLPEFVKTVLKGKEVKVPTKRAADEDKMRPFLIDEARRKNSPSYPKTPLPTAWGKPAHGLQAGIRLNPAVQRGEAAMVLEVVVRNVSEKPIVFSHLQLGFAGEQVSGSVTAKSEEIKSPFTPPGTRWVVLVSPGDAYALASVPIYRPGEGKATKGPRVKLRLGENQVGAEGVAVRLGTGDAGKDVELATGYLDVRVGEKEGSK